MTAPTQLMYLIASKYTVRHRSPAGPARMRRHSPPVPESANSNHSSPFKAIDLSSFFKVISLSSPFKGEARRGMGLPPLKRTHHPPTTKEINPSSPCKRHYYPSPIKGERNHHPSPIKGERNNHPSPIKGERNNHSPLIKGERNNHSSPFKGERNNHPSPFKGEVRRGMGSPPGFPQLPPTPRPKTHSMTTPSHPHRTPGVHP
jgi:hypothetical protein